MATGLNFECGADHITFWYILQMLPFKMKTFTFNQRNLKLQINC